MDPIRSEPTTVQPLAMASFATAPHPSLRSEVNSRIWCFRIWRCISSLGTLPRRFTQSATFRSFISVSIPGRSFPEPNMLSSKSIPWLLSWWANMTGISGCFHFKNRATYINRIFDMSRKLSKTLSLSSALSATFGK